MDLALPLFPRREFAQATLRREDLSNSPIQQFLLWIHEAVEAGVDDPHAMVLATAGADGIPSARVVLLKTLDERGFAFISHYNGPKGQDLAENPNASLLFFWPKVERQVRIAGTISRTTREESLRYFRERPHASQVAVLAGRQSEAVESRQALDDRFRELMEQYSDGEVPLPDTWGGYLLTPTRIEFWQGGVNRLHDRFLYIFQPGGSWRIERLAP